MAFVIMFVVLVLLVPVLADIRKHGRDNILRRSAYDFAQLRPVRATLDLFGLATNAVATGMASAVVLIVVIWILGKMFGALLQ